MHVEASGQGNDEEVLALFAAQAATAIATAAPAVPTEEAMMVVKRAFTLDDEYRQR